MKVVVKGTDVDEGATKVVVKLILAAEKRVNSSFDKSSRGLGLMQLYDDDPYRTPASTLRW